MLKENPTIEQLLGDTDHRYFATGFRGFDFTIETFEVSEEHIHGNLRAHYIGPARPRSEDPHIGSIEFVALSLRIASHALNQLALIGIADADRAFITSYKIRVAGSLSVGILPFHCRMIRSERDAASLQGSRSLFEIKIGESVVLLEVDHRGGVRYRYLPEEQKLDLHYEQLHSLGYKYTQLQLDDISIDKIGARISGSVQYRSLLEENTLHGIGSARDALLATDATRIFGQLMQALHYETQNTDRLRCPNIWLRKMELSSEMPLFDGQCSAEVQFEHIREVQQGAINWKLITLRGHVGNFSGRFEVGHQIREP